MSLGQEGEPAPMTLTHSSVPHFALILLRSICHFLLLIHSVFFMTASDTVQLSTLGKSKRQLTAEELSIAF